MTRKLVVGPMPVIRKKKPSPLVRLFKGRRSALDVLYERSYSMKMGEFSGLRRKYYFLAQPELARKVLAANPERYPKSDLMSTMMRQLLGNGVLISNGEAWSRQRAMMNPAFELARITEVFPQMLAAAEDMRERLTTIVDGSAVEIGLEMSHVTADIIFRTIFSKPLQRRDAETLFRAFGSYQELAYIHGVWSMAGLPHSLSLARLRARPHARVIRGILRRMVQQRLELLQTSPGSAPRDILASLIEARDKAGNPFTEEEIIDQVAVMFLAGHETSASALSWALHLIARDESVQKRMQVEADAAFAEDDLKPSNLRKLKFTRDVFRETMRLYPPIAFVPRDITIPEKMRDKDLKSGSAVFIPIWLLHRHREIWSNPDAFDPDRFEREAEKAAIRQAYMPFSQGPRVCLGASFAMQEAVIILAMVARHFEINADGAVSPRPVSRISLRSENGTWIRMQQRA